MSSNSINKSQFSIRLLKTAGRIYVETQSLVKYLQDCEPVATPAERRRLGRPTKPAQVERKAT